MSEVDYLRYAQLMGARNPMAEGLSSLGDTLDKGYAQKRQNMLDQRQMRLSDLQMQREQMALSEAQREQEYKQGLRDRMSNPQATTQFTPKPVVAPVIQTTPAALQPQPEFSMPQPAASPAVQAYNEGRVKSSTESPAAAGAKFAMSQGRPEEAAKMISVDDALAQYGAKIQAGGGDPKQYYAAKADLDQAKEAFDIIKNFKGQPDLLKAMWPAFVKAYPKAAAIDPTAIEYNKDGMLIPLKNPDGTPVKGKSYVYDNQGKMHIVEDKPEKPQLTELVSPDGKTAQKFFVSPDGKKVPVGEPYKVKSQVTNVNVHSGMNNTDDGEVKSWAKAVREGRANLQDIPQRGTIRSQVVKELENTGGVDYAANKADNAAFSSSITQQQKQLGSMGSFVKNMDAQINKVGELSKKLSTFDTRLLNVPLRAARGRIAGSADQAKYDMYLTEIESEIGKLATGSSASVSELSVSAQEKWDKIHDKNLSIKDMLELLKETREAGKLRMKSVEDQLAETRAQQRNRGKGTTNDTRPPLSAIFGK